MAFSFRSFFGKEKPSDKVHGSSSMTALPPAQGGGHPFQKGFQGNPFASNDVFLGTPAQANGTNGHAAFSPFSPANSGPPSGLTVGDILTLLPPELVKHGVFGPDHPVHLRDEALEKARRTATSSIPLFEIFRVLPALFLSPVAPQDHRMVDLPPHKLGKSPLNGSHSSPPSSSVPAPVVVVPPVTASPFASPFSPGVPPPQLAGGEGAARSAVPASLFHPSPFHEATGPFPGPVPEPLPVHPSPQTGIPSAPAPSPFSGSFSPELTRQPAAVPGAIAGSFASDPPRQTAAMPSPFATASSFPVSGNDMLAFAQPPAPPIFQPRPLVGQHTAPAEHEEKPPHTPSPAPAPPTLGFSPLTPPFGQPASPAVANGHPQSPFGPLPGSNSPVPNGSFPSGDFTAQETNPFYKSPHSTSLGFSAPQSAPVPELDHARPSAPSASQGDPFFSKGSQPPVPFEGSASAFSPTLGLPPVAQPPLRTPVAPPISNSFPEAPAVHGGGNPFDRIKALGQSGDAHKLGDSALESQAKSFFSAFHPAQQPAPATTEPAFGFPPPVPGSPSLPANFFEASNPPAPKSPPAIPSPLLHSSLASVPPAPGGMHFADEAAPQPPKGQSRVTLSLASALARCTEREIGVKPEMIPSWIQVSLPVGVISQQGGNGKMSVRIVEIMRGLEPEFRNILSPSNTDVLVELPANEVFHALPGSTTASPPVQPTTPLAPETPVSPASVPLGIETLGSLAWNKPVVSPSLDHGVSSGTVPSLFREKQPSVGGETPPMSSTPWFTEDNSPAEAGGNLSGPAFPTSLFSPSAKEDPPAIANSTFNRPAPRRADPAPRSGGESAAPQAPTTRTISASAITLSPNLKASSGPPPLLSDPERPPVTSRPNGEKNRQLLLRVLLGTEDRLATEDVIRLTGQLVGVSAAICLHRGEVLGSSSNGSPEAESFIRQAPLFQQHLRPLVQLTGIIDTETLSMRSDQQLVTFSIQQDTLLGVLHDPGRQEPTLQERITLIARELTALIEPPALQA